MQGQKQHRFERLIPLAMCGLMFFSSVTRAQPKDNKPAAVSRDLLVSQLDSDEYAERYSATRRLLADRKTALNGLGHHYLDADARREAAALNVIIEDMATLYREATTPERRNRLIDIARHHFVSLMRLKEWPGKRSAALGVIQSAIMPQDVPEPVRQAIQETFGKEDAPVIRVVNTLPGFPAYGQLEPGDLVVKVNGQFLPVGQNTQDTSGHFGRTILAQSQHDEMRLTIWREDRFVPVTVELASSDAIRNLYEPTNSQLLPQFQARWIHFRERMMATGQPEPALEIDLGKPEEPGNED